MFTFHNKGDTLDLFSLFWSGDINIIIIIYS